MIRLMSAEELANYPTVSLEGLSLDSVASGSSAGASTPSSCERCAAYRTGPQLDGSLLVDPEIHLPSPGMDVDIAYYYSSNTPYNGPFGYGRTINTNLTAQASGSPAIVTFQRGNGAVVSYQDDGSGNFVPKTPNLINTLVKDVPNSLWKETTPDGRLTAYPLNTAGMITTVSYAEDAVGNRHTFAHASGLLQTLQDAVGRKVSFAYDGNNLLSNIQDWADRRTTFAYDTASVAGKPLLTTVTGPSGCVTGYGYDSSALLTRITDPNGYDTTYAYDALNRVISRSVATAGLTRYLYNTNQTLVINPLGARTTVTLDSQRDLNVMVNADGVATTFTRNAIGQEISRMNVFGAITTTLYDSAGVTKGQVDALGRITTVQRDIYNNPTTITRADGTVLQKIYGYAGSGFDTTGAKRLLQVDVDPLGNRTSYSYNGRGQMLAMQDALGALTTFGYDGFGNRVSATNALGYTTTQVYDLAGNVVGAIDAFGNTTTLSYDPQNRPLSITDPLGYTTSMGYDSVGNMVVQIDALGQRTSYSYNVFDKPVTVQNALGYVGTTIYDAIGRATARIDALGFATSTLYDAADRVLARMNALGYRTSIAYDAVGRRQATIDPLGYRTTTVYDLVGRPQANVDALGRRTTTVYDLLDRPIANVNAFGQVSSMAYDVMGRPIASIDALGYASTMVYDAAGRRIASVNALGYSTSYGYDAVGQMVRTQDARGAISSSIYDARGQRVVSVDTRGFLSTTVYDALGQQIESFQNYYLFASQPIRTTWLYDAVGQVSAQIDARNFRTSYSYDAVGQNVEVLNARGFRTTNQYDAVGRMKSEQDALDYNTALSYDALGQRLAVTDAMGNVTSSLYDARGRLFSEQSAWGTLVTSTYDAVGNVLLRVDGRGLATTYAYDVLDRIVLSTVIDGALTTHVYDTVGRETALWDSSGIATTSYDAVGQVNSVLSSAAVGGALVNYSLAYAYDQVGNRVQLRDGEGRLTTYSYSPAVGILDWAKITGPYEANYSEIFFDGQGRVSEKYLANLQASNLLQRYAPTGEPFYHYYTKSGAPQEFFYGTLDEVGNYSTLLEQTPPMPYTTTYLGYDATNQLLSERRQDTPGYANTYTYDGTGNRLTQNALGIRTTYQYGAGNRLLSEQTGTAFTTYSYDQAGNLNLINAANALTTYSWNTDNRLIKVDNPDGSSEQMSYGADGLRRKKSVTPAGGPTSDTIFVYDGQNLLQERNGSGLILAHYTWGPEQWNIYTGRNWAAGSIGNSVLLQRRASTPGDLAGGISSYFGSDQSSNIRLLFDSSGNVTDRMTYKAFGELFGHTGSTVTPFGFSGSVGVYTDALRRLHAMLRDLDPMTGKWLSMDPIGFGGGDINLTRYVDNNPINSVDPSGLFVQVACAVACGLGLGGVAALYAGCLAGGAGTNCDVLHCMWDTFENDLNAFQQTAITIGLVGCMTCLVSELGGGASIAGPIINLLKNPIPRGIATCIINAAIFGQGAFNTGCIINNPAPNRAAICSAVGACIGGGVGVATGGLLGAGGVATALSGLGCNWCGVKLGY